jgi:hypothetical protein
MKFLFLEKHIKKIGSVQEIPKKKLYSIEQGLFNLGSPERFPREKNIHFCRIFSTKRDD